MAGNGSGYHDKAQRFRDAALPHLDDLYTLARYLLHEAADAEDAVQECYLRALRHFDKFRGPAIKPWLFAILRNICRGEFARRSRAALTMDGETDEDENCAPLWQDAPEAEMLHQRDAEPVPAPPRPKSLRRASAAAPGGARTGDLTVLLTGAGRYAERSDGPLIHLPRSLQPVLLLERDKRLPSMRAQDPVERADVKAFPAPVAVARG